MSSDRVWREAQSNGKSYFYNYLTNETTWLRPEDSEMEELPPPPPGEPPEAQVVTAPVDGTSAVAEADCSSPSATAAAVQPYLHTAAPYTMPPYASYPPYVPQPQYGAAPGVPYGLAPPPSLTDFQPVLAPPPKPPPMLHPQQLEPPPLPPQPGQEEFYRRPDNWPGRSYHKSLGESIHRLQVIS